MRRVPFDGFIGAAYQAAAWKASTQRCLNLYPETDPEKGTVLYGTPGHTTLATIGNAPILAIEATPSGLFIVSADGAYFATGISNGVLQGLTTLASTANAYAVIAQGGDRVMYVNGNQGFVYDRTLNTFAPITSPDFPSSPVSCAFLDGYFIVHDANSDRFQWSAPFDPQSWDPLDFASAENVNDNLRRAITVERELYLIGDLSTEIWATTGTEDVFDRIQGTYIPYGTPALLSAAVIGQSLLWLAQDENGGALVMRARGLQASRVSTHAIEQELATYPTLEDAIGFAYQQRGHLFYCLTFPIAGKTWVLDLSTMLWHERSSQLPDPSQPNQTAPISYVQEAWRASCHAYFGGFNLIGDRINNTLSILSPDTYTENGVDIVRLRSSPHILNLYDEITVNALEVVCQPGVGNTARPNPVAMLRVSKDGGKTWGVQRQNPLGAQGKYSERIKWRRLGRARDIVAEVTISDPVFSCMTAAVLEVE